MYIHFKVKLAVEAAYNLLSFAYRADLHGNIAKYLSNHYHDDLATYASLIANHWTKVVENVKDINIKYHAAKQAILLLQKAALEAKRQGSDIDVVVSLEQAMSLFEILPNTQKDIQILIIFLKELIPVCLSIRGPRKTLIYAERLYKLNPSNQNQFTLTILQWLCIHYTKHKLHEQVLLPLAYKIQDISLAIKNNNDSYDHLIIKAEAKHILSIQLLLLGKFQQARLSLDDFLLYILNIYIIIMIII